MKAADARQKSTEVTAASRCRATVSAGAARAAAAASGPEQQKQGGAGGAQGAGQIIKNAQRDT